MQTFLEETLLHLKAKHQDISALKIVLPSKRAGGFLKNYLKNQAEETAFLPEIVSIEEFIEELSGLSIIDPTELLFQSYQVYLTINAFKEKETFQSYVTWINTLLNDFNEIDRHLLDTNHFFSYLNSIKTLEKWNVSSGSTEMIDNYLSFWSNLKEFYHALNTKLQSNGLGYQGAVYRSAKAVSPSYAEKTQTTHVFIGFNALNAAEQQIIQDFLNRDKGTIYWDTDSYFYENKKHSASLFIRRYIGKWAYFQKNPPKNIPSNYGTNKTIHTVEVQKNIGQAKYIGQLLSSYSKEQLNNTAIVLADEQLLVPLLHSLPTTISDVNITMGVPIKNFPSTIFFERTLALHKEGKETFYYKDVFSILQHTVGVALIPDSQAIVQHIATHNTTQISLTYLLSISEIAQHENLRLLFSNWNLSSTKAISAFLDILLQLKAIPQKNTVDRVVHFNLYQVFSKMEALIANYEYASSIKTIESLFSEAIATTTIDFKGDAYTGLQIMGVLESRVLDFENVIIASVNEGIFPSGKSNASFITYDLKKEFQLPLYTEKDAIYTYHFYKMLHRATSITLLYNSHADGLNTGERSRFLLQLEVEGHPNHAFSKVVLTPEVSVVQPEKKRIEKTPEVMERIREIGTSKFSPSALTTYIRNPIDFYYQKVLRISEADDVEETIAANTLGTVVHETLEELYTPLINKELSVKILENLKTDLSLNVQTQFKKLFKDGTISTGKNLLIFEVAKRFILNFINAEISNIKNGDTIKILHLEKEMVVPIDIPTLEVPVKIGGTVDRVDLCNGVLRIIDYKTGLVTQNQLELIEWEPLTQDYKYSKAFQVLAYATMLESEIPVTGCEAGIISFKNMQNGFLKFATKPSSRGAKNRLITAETLQEFKIHLASLIAEICDPSIPFTEKEIE